MNTLRWIRTAQALLVVASVLAIAHAVRSSLQRPQSVRATAPLPSDVNAIPPADSRPEPPADVEAIVGADLFGFGGDLAVIDELAAGSADAGVAAGLRLVGTITGPPALARALIQDTRTQTTTRHRLGDRIAGAEIVSIGKNEVVLREGQQRKILRRSSGRSGVDDAPASPPVARREPSVVAVPLPPGPPPERTLVPDLLLKAAIRPRVVDGTPTGLEISGLDQVPLAHQVGLRDGDVIRVLNGQRVTDRQKAYQVLRKAKSLRKLTIELTRDGQDKTLRFP